MGEQRRGRALRVAGWTGVIAMLELLAETRFFLTSLTTGSPLAYRGVLVEMPAAVWFALLLLLESLRARITDEQVRRRWNVYVFAWTILALAAMVWAFRHADQSVRTNWQYWVASGCISVSFVVAASQELLPFRSVLRKSPRQVLLAAARDIAFVAGRLPSLLVLAGCGLLVAFGPYARDVPTRRERPLHGTQLVEWFEKQPRTLLPQRYRVAPVVVVTFLDYQCPACLSSSRMLDPVFRELSAAYGSRIGFLTIDFPLEDECNQHDAEPSSLHPAACEAAAAVRIAQLRGKPVQPLIDWFWNHQRDLNRDVVAKTARDLAGVELTEADYRDAVAAVRSDAALAYGLGVRSTPSFWINGVITRRRGPDDMRTLILHELNKLENAGRDERTLGASVGPTRE